MTTPTTTEHNYPQVTNCNECKVKQGECKFYCPDLPEDVKAFNRDFKEIWDHRIKNGDFK